MKIEFTKSFEKTLKKLNEEDKKKTKKKINGLIDALEAGKKSKGLGIRKLRFNFWEIRITLKIRVVFEVQEFLLRLIIVGSHDDIKKFLSNL